MQSCDISSGFLYPCFHSYAILVVLLLSNFHSLLDFSFVVKSKVENMVGLCKGVEKSPWAK